MHIISYQLQINCFISGVNLSDYKTIKVNNLGNYKFKAQISKSSLFTILNDYKELQRCFSKENMLASECAEETAFVVDKMSNFVKEAIESALGGFATSTAR